MILIKGGRLVDAGNFDGPGNILVDNGKIAEIKETGEKNNREKETGVRHPALKSHFCET